MKLQDVISQFQDIPNQTISIQDAIHSPKFWIVSYLVVMVLVGWPKTKKYAQTFSSPIMEADYYGAVLCFITSPIWLVGFLPYKMISSALKSLGKNIVGR